MGCLNPIRIRNPRYTSDSDVEFTQKVYRFYEDYGYVNPPDRYIDVPCGKCVACQSAKRNGWRMRLLAEFYRYPASAFITLTFDDTHLERFKDNPNKALSLFFDRVRKFCGRSIRHFICPELGDKTKRLHYHGILFDVPGLNGDLLSSLWKYGFIYLGWCNPKTINYVTKYVTKFYDTAVKLPRLFVSKGIGIDFLKNYGVELKDNMTPYFTSNGYRIPLPRYYLEKLFDKTERFLLQFVASQKVFTRYVDGKVYYDVNSYKDALKRYYDKLKSISLVDLSKPSKDVGAIKSIALDLPTDYDFLDEDDNLELIDFNAVPDSSYNNLSREDLLTINPF